MGYYSVRAGFAAAGGRIEVIEAVRPGEGRGGGYYPALLNLGSIIGEFATRAKVSSRGPDGVAQQIMYGTRYMVARFMADANGDSAPTTSPIIAAARIRPTQNMPTTTRLFGRQTTVPFVNVDVLEVAGDGLLPSGDGEVDEHNLRCRVAAAGILYTVAAEPGMEGGFVQVTGRYGQDFPKGGCDPRDPAFFTELGFQRPDDAPAWGAEGGVMVAPARLITAGIAKAYGPALQIA